MGYLEIETRNHVNVFRYREACLLLARWALAVVLAHVIRYLLVPFVIDKTTLGIEIDAPRGSSVAHDGGTGLNPDAVTFLQLSRFEILSVMWGSAPLISPTTPISSVNCCAC